MRNVQSRRAQVLHGEFEWCSDRRATSGTRAHHGIGMERHSVTNHAQESKRLSGHVCHVQDIKNDFVTEVVPRCFFVTDATDVFVVALITAKILDSF